MVSVIVSPAHNRIADPQDDGRPADVQCMGERVRHEILSSLSPELPVLIAGPTASGKSSLALEIASRQGGTIVNADALQVFSNWNLLTARPQPVHEATAPHLLYGHIAGDADYSVGHWLREVEPLLANGQRMILVGGTGLYFTALTEGLADIPAVPPELRAEAQGRLQSEGPASLLTELDATTRSRLDSTNPMRILRAWEVWRATGRGLASWQDDTPDPLVSLDDAQPLLVDADRDWLADRIDHRFEAMVKGGVIDEVRRNLASWNPALPSAKAIGAAELVDHLRGNRDLEDAVAAGKAATRRYAKRQRTWFRSRMWKWRRLSFPR